MGAFYRVVFLDVSFGRIVVQRIFALQLPRIIILWVHSRIVWILSLWRIVVHVPLGTAVFRLFFLFWIELIRLFARLVVWLVALFTFVVFLRAFFFLRAFVFLWVAT